MLNLFAYTGGFSLHAALVIFAFAGGLLMIFMLRT